MGILLALAAAVLYGSSDFGGGLASRRLGSLRVAVVGSAAATVLAWATLSVVGPLSAVGAAVVPVAAGVALGERPSLLSVAGVLVALPAIVLVAASGSVRGKLGAGLLDGLAAGLAFGILFIGLAQAGRNAGLWPVASEQTGALLITLALAVKTREPLRIPLRAAGLPVLVGASGMAATLAYFYATHFSMLAIAAVLVSLYPGITVLFARTLLHERFTPAQRTGLGLCALAIAAIALN
jgi:drug/metabolite transporter (DMT)-like permease